MKKKEKECECGGDIKEWTDEKKRGDAMHCLEILYLDVERSKMDMVLCYDRICFNDTLREMRKNKGKEEEEKKEW